MSPVITSPSSPSNLSVLTCSRDNDNWLLRHPCSLEVLEARVPLQLKYSEWGVSNVDRAWGHFLFRPYSTVSPPWSEAFPLILSHLQSSVTSACGDKASEEVLYDKLKATVEGWPSQALVVKIVGTEGPSLCPLPSGGQESRQETLS